MNSKQLTCTQLTLFAVAAAVVQITGLSLFVLGFFPVKPALSGVSGQESFFPPGCDFTPNRTGTPIFPELSGIPPLYDRLILMVIDGLPAEFVLGKDGQSPRKDFVEAMPYTQSLLSSGMAIGYHAKAAPPTVTMPRLKAMVSGAIGGFLDVAFNFNTMALLDDNLLGQLFKIGWKMVMLGDETWLKLFPGMFMRHDGVSSFYVKDTIQVDQNVSRHLENELSSKDWNLLILHYLGLDHVGHIGGRKSFLMAPKLKEMDDVVKMIHSRTINTHHNGQGDTLLVVVSDHGMTENGNHGGSSYEETDSLALFVGLKSDHASTNVKFVDQVDIAPTLALLLGVPIPKNNVGVLISETFDSLTEDKRLRAMELNSWQLLRLVQAQIPDLPCGNFPCDGSADDLLPRSRECIDTGNNIAMLCCLYMNAAKLRSTWRSKKISGSNSEDDYNSSVGAYYKFLKTASEWLSRRVTDKPIGLLSFGIVAMVISCVIFLGLLVCLDSKGFCDEKEHHSNLSDGMPKWHWDEIFSVIVVLFVVMSMGSSSMVEEEQYIWHYMLSTLYLLLLRKSLQSFPEGKIGSGDYQLYSIFLLLFSGRILRGWHQGGVNWTYLPDISKWLEQAWGEHMRYIQLTSGLLVVCFGIFASTLIRSTTKILQVMKFLLLISGLLVVCYITEFQDNALISSSFGATLLAQSIYTILGVIMVITVVILPWFFPIWITGTSLMKNANSSTLASIDNGHKNSSQLLDCSYVIGLMYTICWCLLQLLVQQSINSMPIFLLLLQIFASMVYYSHSGPRNKEWVEVASLYYLGMTGHFALGNSNTLATIDVAGAFIGLSSHSMVLSGILMFCITYASPMLALLSMVMYNSVKYRSHRAASQNTDLGHLLEVRLGFPCLVPLAVNSILLTGYTIVLLVMRNHLFVWSVFSPKYLYVCAATVCIYIGIFVMAVTEFYTCWVLAFRRMRRHAGFKSAMGNDKTA